MKHLLALACLSLAAAALSSCQSYQAHGTMYLEPGVFASQQPGQTVGPPPDTVSFWDGGAGNGPSRIHIDISQQVANFYRGDVLVGRSKLSTGDANHPSPTGKLSILEKHKDHISSRYGDYVYPDGSVAQANVDLKKDRRPPGSIFKGSPMTNFMRITWDGVGMHAGYLPGYPASHGCIRMPEHMSAIFYDNVKLGTPVLVTP